MDRAVENRVHVKQVAIVGGTHGNEVTGVSIVKHWQRSEAQFERFSTLNVVTHLANLKAIAENRRYLDRDLNRCFQFSELDDGKRVLYEECRAKALDQLFGRRAEQRADFVIDLHTTTSNMGSSIVITERDPLTYSLAAYLSHVVPDLKVYYKEVNQSESPYLFSLGRLGGVLIEIGPTPQGVLRFDVYQKTLTLIEETLLFLEKWNQSDLPELPDAIPAYQFIESLLLPRTPEGELNGMIHEHIQDRDVHPLKRGEPIFRLLSGETVLFEPDSDETFYPVFVNEAAYYDQLKGLSLMKGIELSST